MSLATASITKDSKRETVSESITEEQKLDSKFINYFNELSSLEIKAGEAEPLYLKQIRPFLLATEVNSLGRFAYGNKKGKARKNKKEDTVKTFTASNVLPNLKPIISDNKPYKIVQEFTLTAWLVLTTSPPVGVGADFTVNSLNQASILAQLFDQYMITQVEVWLIPSFLGSDPGGLLYSVIDYDNSTAITTVVAMNNYSNVAVTPADQGHYRRFTPHIAVDSYSSAFTNFTNVGPQWIDWNSPSVAHYGFKALVTTNSNVGTYDLQVRLTVLNRNVI